MADKYKLTISDLRIRYQDCFVRLLKPKKGEAGIGIMGEDFKQDDDGEATHAYVIMFTVDEKNQTKGDARYIPMKELDLVKMDVGCINTARSVVILNASKPEHNSKYRTLLPTNTVELIDPLKGIRAVLDVRSPDRVKDWFILSSWAANEMATPDEAYAVVDSGDYMARAFSNRFFYTISERTDDIVLMYMNNVAGRVVDGMLVLLEWAGRFKEELEGYGIQCTIGKEKR